MMMCDVKNAELPFPLRLFVAEEKGPSPICPAAPKNFNAAQATKGGYRNKHNVTREQQLSGLRVNYHPLTWYSHGP